MTECVIGIDVQAARDCPYAVIDASSRIIDQGWLPTARLGESVRALARHHPGATFAIDAPRVPLPGPRAWYWGKSGWRPRTPGDRGRGRHCEVVIAAHRLANPQWTPLAADAPPWIRHGFSLFQALDGIASCLEVFPSASYRMLNEAGDVRVEMPLSGFLQGPKDMLDAVVAAVTGREFLAGRGQEVGGGDGLGTIVLPRRITTPIQDVMIWPIDQ